MSIIVLITAWTYAAFLTTLFFAGGPTLESALLTLVFSGSVVVHFLAWRTMTRLQQENDRLTGKLVAQQLRRHWWLWWKPRSE